MKSFLLTVLLLGLGTSVVAAESGPGAWSLPEPLWAVSDPADLRACQRLWAEVRARVAADLGVASLPAKGEGPVVRILVSGEPGSLSTVIRLEGGTSDPGVKYLPFSLTDPAAGLVWARAIEATVRALVPAPARPAPPVLVDTFSPSDLQGTELAVPASTLLPFGMGLRGDRLVVALGSAVVELDSRWQVVGQPARALADEGLLNYAYGLAVSPAGTLFVRSSDSSSLWAFAEGIPSYTQPRWESAPGGVFGVLTDGSPFSVTTSPKAVRVFRQGRVDEVPVPSQGFILGAGAGPEGTLWLGDSVNGSVRVVTAEGLVLNVLYPELPSQAVLLKLKVLGDGSFFGVTTSDLRKFDPTGRLLWAWDGRAEGLSITWAPTIDVVPAADGVIYLNDATVRKLLRLAEDPSRLGPDWARVAEATRQIRADDRRPEGWAALADAYAHLGADEALRATLARYQALRPADAAVSDRLAGVRVRLLKSRAQAGVADVAALLSRLGPESGRDTYTRTMRTLEALRALAPRDPEVSTLIAGLKRLWAEADAGPRATESFPEVRSFRLAALFPSLLTAYRTRPAGSLVVANTLDEPITDLRAELLVPRYMDFPTEGTPVARLAPGAEATLDLRALLSDRVLDIEEDLPVQVQVTLRFTDSRGPRSFTVFRPVTLYRRTALTWDDTAKLAGFITPNEDTVNRATFQVLGAPDSGGRPYLTSAFTRAAALCAALGTLPLRYVPDPQSSFETVSVGEGQVDTVRFPRTTLAYRAGDCDDTTALLASVLEAAGVSTAILTTPGHVFLAFDSGQKSGVAWALDAPGFRTLDREGRLWIPLETTTLAQGFAASWKAASALVDRYAGEGHLGFLTLASARTTYPALPIPATSLPGPRFDPAATEALGQTDRVTLDRDLYATIAARLEASRTGVQGAAWSKATNRLAQVQALYGRPDRAIATLEALVARDRTYVSAYLNLATLRLEAGDPAGAARWLAVAKGVAPGSNQVAAYGNPVAMATETGPGRAGLAPGPSWAED